MTTPEPAPIHICLAAIEGDEIVIRVPIAAIPFAADIAMDFEWFHGEDATMKIVDAKLFAEDLLTELLREDEEGTTMVHLMLDKAILAAVEAGAEGVEEIKP